MSADPLTTVRALLARHASRRPEDAAVVERFLDLLETGPACLDRRGLPGHLTASALVLDDAGERVLLVLHRKLGRWLQPGGHVDGEARLERAALREAREETGIGALELLSPDIEPTPIDLDVHAIPAHGDEPAHQHFDVRFLLRAPPGAVPSCSEESLAVRWFDRTELEAAAADASVLRLATRAFEALTKGGLRALALQNG